MPRILSASLVLPLLAVAACSSDPSMTQSEVESYVETTFSENDALGPVQSVACEDGLAAREGDQVNCQVGGEDKRTDVTVLVEGVNDEGLELSLRYMLFSGLD